MDDNFRKEQKPRIFDDGTDTIAPPVMAAPRPPEARFETVPHPKAHEGHTGQQAYAPHAHFKFPKKKFVVGVGVSIAVLSSGFMGFLYLKHSKANNLPLGSTNGRSSTSKPATIALYYPKNLPSGYTYNNDLKTLKADVMYFSVTGPKNEVFSVTQQPIPVSFDFQTFNKKFLTPDTFTTSSGTVTAGPIGANMIGSIRTSKNTWIIINAATNISLSQLETVARSFELSQ